MKFRHVESPLLEEISATTTNEGGRYYSTPKGKLPSVTTVTGFKKSKFFAKWRAENPKEAKRVTTRGNTFHSLIEDYLNNEFEVERDKGEIRPDILELFLQLQPELDKIDNILALEVPLWSDTVGLAGRVDCVAEHDGELSIIDFKGATRKKRTSDIENYFLQATAYALMWQDRTGKEIKKFKILISCEDGTAQVFEGAPIQYTKKLYDTIQEYKESLGLFA
jgi:genome maintenance exonuclease 1|tara:strand:+ start:2045 stop:2710 length:666 start_codon:yes stop_codon:yes gene_type:complete